MREASRTTRQKIADQLREMAMEAGEIANEFEVRTSVALNHVEHIARSLDETDEQLLVSPPTCQECGFDEFDDLINRPSRCPECKSESVSEPAFTIERA